MVAWAASMRCAAFLLLILLVAREGRAAEPPPAVRAPAGPERPPPLDEDLELPSLEKEERVAIGAHALLVTRLAEAEVDGEATKTSYDPAPGVGVAARVLVHDYFQVGAAWKWSSHALTFERGALGLGGVIEMDSVSTYTLALHLLPTLPIGERVRLWASAGLGWGRTYYPPMRVRDGSGAFVVRDRAASFVEFPLGLGGMVEIVPGWLALDMDVTAAPTLPEDGSARVPITTLDGQGRRREVGGLPGASVGFVQALGLSVLL